VCLAARGADRLTFIGLFISLRIVQDIDLYVREFKKRHTDRL